MTAAVSEDSAALDSVLRHHLSLDPATKEDLVANEISHDSVKNSKLKKRVSLKEFTHQPPGNLPFCQFIITCMCM